jgi:N-acetylglutamate synthase-like GNAT family acetyltransferase
MIIREQTPGDRGAVEALLRYLFEDVEHLLPDVEKALAQVMAYQIPGSTYAPGFERLGVVAVEDGIVIGFALAERLYPMYAILSYLVIGPEFQDNGAGTQLLNFVVNRMKACRVEYLDLMALPDRESFYAMNGFQGTGGTHMRRCLAS